jgi:hypothetical protein
MSDIVSWIMKYLSLHKLKADTYNPIKTCNKEFLSYVQKAFIVIFNKT